MGELLDSWAYRGDESVGPTRTTDSADEQRASFSETMLR